VGEQQRGTLRDVLVRKKMAVKQMEKRSVSDRAV
jgi:hypothetical protein